MKSAAVGRYSVGLKANWRQTQGGWRLCESAFWLTDLLVAKVTRFCSSAGMFGPGLLSEARDAAEEVVRKDEKPAGGAHTAKQVHRWSCTAPALGLRAGSVDAAMIEQTTFTKEIPMWFRSRADYLRLRPLRRPIRRRPQPATACRLKLEALEDRTLPSFMAPVNYAVGTDPVAVVTAALANSGKLDLITANFDANTISVRMGNGDGTFGAAATYAVGTEPAALAVGDFNSDGKLDVAVANKGSNTVSVLLGNGDSTFQAAKSYAVGSEPSSVAIGNFDGKLDIVTANQGDDSVSLLPGSGNGTFGTAQKVASYGQPVVSVAVGDFNGDGKLDLAAATRGTDGSWGLYGYYPGGYPGVTVLLGNGNGTFTTGTALTLPDPFAVPPTDFSPPAIAAADLNGDGKLDLVVTDAGDGVVDVLLNNGDGTFGGPASFSSFNANGAPDSVAVADFNGDGKPDLVTTNQGDTLSVLPGDGKGNFGNPYTFTVGTGPVSAATGDFNGDGKTDLAVADSADNNISVLLNNGSWPSLVVTATDPSTGAAISSTTAGQSFNLTVTADDLSGNVMTNCTDTVSFSTWDAQGTIIDPVTGNSVSLQNFTYTFTAADHGTHTFSVDLKTAGSQVVAVSDLTAGTTPTGPDLTVNPGAFSTFAVSGFPSPTAADAGGSFTVTAYDAYGNVASNYTGTVILSSSEPTATFFDDNTGSQLAGNRYTFSPSDSGTHTFAAVLNTTGKNQSITATDSVNPAATASQTGIAVDPAVTISGPTYGYINQTLTYTLGAIGDPAGTLFTYQINWGDGSGVQTVSGTSGTTVTHAFSTAGYRVPTVTATDASGLSGSGSAQVDTMPVTVAIQTDPAHTSQQMLIITDISSNLEDYIGLTSAADNGVSLTFGRIGLGTITPTNGNPFALVMGFAGSGIYDTINAMGLSINTVLVGGSGGTSLYGGSARNLLIAGTGAGGLEAGSAGDILIGGSTTYENNPTALAYIMAEWDSSDSYSTRIKKITSGGGLNGSYLLNSSTVSDNGVSNPLYGGAGLDWFFAHTKGKNADKVYNLTSGEVVTQI
jgi:hypothetical protein